MTIISPNHKTTLKMSQKSKKKIQQTYSLIATQSNERPCCCNSKKQSIITTEYDLLGGYLPDADLKLGCGLPTGFAGIKPGDTVVDLGSGAGNDCFVARYETGETGRVIGIDFTDAMVEKARANAQKLNFSNVEFIRGDIEDLPLPDNTADVVVSNCVMNLVPDKARAFSEVFRILKEGGHFSISDIVLTGVLSGKVKKVAERYAGCTATAIQKEDYLQIIRNAGFKNLSLQAEKPIIVPDELLKEQLSAEEIDQYKSQKNSIFSITVYGDKQG